MTITASQVKELRERTGAGMMECKKALQASNGDMEAAIEAMRKSGIAKAAKKAGRTAAEGVVVTFLSSDKQQAVILEINSETDFVARDENFVKFSQQVAERASAEGISDLDALMNVPYQAGEEQTIEQARQALVTKIGENVNVRRVQRIAGENTLGCYVHGGRIGVLVEVNGGSGELAKDIAMHIAASNPEVVAPEDVKEDRIQKERDIFTAQAQESDKPADIIEKMITGRIKKFLNEISLLGQPFVKDPNKNVANLLKENNANVVSFVRFEVGEGIEKKTEDFAAEVMAQVHGE